MTVTFTRSKWSPTGIARITPGKPGEYSDIRAVLNWQDTSPPFRGELTIEAIRADSSRCRACALGRAHSQALHDAGKR